MSFSSEVRSELAQNIPAARHCRIAGLAAVLDCIGQFRENPDGTLSLFIAADNPDAVRKCFTLIKKTISMKTELQPVPAVGKGSHSMVAVPLESQEVRELALMLKAVSADGTFRAAGSGVSPLLLKKDCCRRSCLADLYLCIGSMSDPQKEYHLEFDCSGDAQADLVRSILREHGIEARVITRKKYRIVYVKESEAIINILNLMGAPVSLMKMENFRIFKDIRNNVNRKVNCETANISKTVNAAQKQIEAILLLEQEGVLHRMSEDLRRTAEARVSYPDATLKELGSLMNPPASKSAVNHRLRRLSQAAEKLRQGR